MTRAIPEPPVAEREAYNVKIKYSELERLYEEAELLKAQIHDLKEESSAYARGVEDGKKEAVDKAVADERERCARMVDYTFDGDTRRLAKKSVAE